LNYTRIGVAGASYCQEMTSSDGLPLLLYFLSPAVPSFPSFPIEYAAQPV